MEGSITQYNRALNIFELTDLLNSPKDFRNRVILRLIYICGLKTHELINMDCEYIDFKAMRINIESDNGSKRMALIDVQTAYLIKQYLEDERPGDDTGALILSNRHTRISKSQIERIIKKYSMGQSDEISGHECL